MPALCGPLGPMICLNQATCNVTSGFCENCPAGFRNDEVMFQGNQNCGLSVVGITFIYIFTGVFALAVGTTALLAAIRKKKSRMRKMLFLVTAWNFVLPFYVLAHYLEGYRFGIASVILFTTILMMVNTQVSVMTYTIESFMNVLCSNTVSSQRIYRVALAWYGFWMLNKLICAIVMLVGVAEESSYVFNIGQATLACSLLVEVGSNIFNARRHDQRLVRAVHALHKDLKLDSVNPVVREFAERVAKGSIILPFYALLFLTLGIAIPVLFIVYDSSVPYAFVMWALLVMTWPLLGFQPIILLQTKLGRQMDRTGGGSTAVQSTITVGRGKGGSARSPRSTSKSRQNNSTGEEIVPAREASVTKTED